MKIIWNIPKFSNAFVSRVTATAAPVWASAVHLYLPKIIPILFFESDYIIIDNNLIIYMFFFKFIN